MEHKDKLTAEEQATVTKFLSLLEPFQDCEEPTPESKAVVKKWAEEYRRTHPEK